MKDKKVKPFKPFGTKVKPNKPLGVKVKSENKNFDYLKIAQPIKN
jgi:hypothetical protein